jgi:LPXTG-motif cell wall-anchored protein
VPQNDVDDDQVQPVNQVDSDDNDNALALTGASGISIMAGGAVLLIFGLLLLYATRRRSPY